MCDWQNRKLIIMSQSFHCYFLEVILLSFTYQDPTIINQDFPFGKDDWKILKKLLTPSLSPPCTRILSIPAPFPSSLCFVLPHPSNGFVSVFINTTENVNFNETETLSAELSGLGQHLNTINSCSQAIN